MTLKAWSKVNGALLSSLMVNASYNSGLYRIHEGLVVDECDRVYVGGSSVIHVYTFNGTSFTVQPNITSTISGEVYDLVLNHAVNSLIVGGIGFLSVVPATSCSSSTYQMTINTTVDSCLGTATVSASGGTAPYTFIWSNGDTTSNVSGIPNGTNLSVTVTDNSCYANIATTSVTFSNTFTTSISSVNSICQGETLTLTASGSGTFLWSSGQTTSSITVNPLSTTTYTVTVSMSGCTGSATKTVQVYPLPVVNLGNDTTFCQIPSFTLQAGSGFAGYLWSTGATTSTITANQNGTYWVSVTNSWGCNDTDMIHIVFGQAYNINHNISICQGDSVFCAGQYHNTSGVYPDIYHLASGCDSVITTNLSVLSQYLFQNNYKVCPGDSLLVAGHYYHLMGTYHDTLTAQGGCDSILVINLSYYTLPVFSLGPDKSICIGDSVKLDCQLAGLNYHWNTGAISQSIYAHLPGTYIITVTDSHGCKKADTIIIAVLPVPILSINPVNPEICIDSSVILTATGALTYTWSPFTGLSISTGASVVASPSNSITYYITGTNAQGCSADTSVHVNVLPAPFSSLTDSAYVCLGDILLLDPGYCDFCNYIWSTGATTRTISINLPGIYSVILNNGSCGLTDSIVVQECMEFWVPNVFTPNGDGKNDNFLPKGINIEYFDMYIFNRWGEEIFKTKDLTTGWDGKYKGTLCPDGVYFYLIYYKGHGTGQTLIEGKKAGSVTLLK